LLSTSRLVTLTGVGGVGKTRLAARVAEDLQDDYPDGVFLVELAKVTEPALLATVVADALGIRDQSARSSVEVLTEYLQDRRLLLILDNCEHLLDACGTLAGTVLRAAADVVVLATSRESLGVLGEYSWPVPPMSMPDLANVAPSRGGYVYGHEALELFAERAKAVLPDFVLDSVTKPAVAQLCQRLDGLPLAIELAAVRLRALSVEQIVARLENRYRLLSTGNRGGPARHQTLRATVDWSYGLCSEQGKALWARLSTFAGEFDLDAAEAVCADGAIGPDEVLELVAELVDKSIVLREGSGARVRYRMLETIREYGKEQLAETGDTDFFQQRHRDYYLRLAQRSEEDWFGAGQVEWRERLQSEQSNLWSALDYCLTKPGETLTGLRLAGALFYYWNACGHLPDGRYWLDRALHTDRRPTSERAKALWVNGFVAMTQGDNGGANGYFSECLELAEELDDQQARAFAQQFRGSSEQFKGNLELAEQLLAESVAYYRRTGVVNSLTVLALAQLGFVSCLIGAPERAIELCEEGRTISEAHGELWALSWGLWVCGLARWTLGEFDQAADSLVASLEAKHALNDRLGMSACVELLAWVAMERGDAHRACRLFGASRTLWATVGAPLFGSAALVATHDDYEGCARRTLGEKSFAQTFGRAKELRIADSVILASGKGEEVPDSVVPGQVRLTRREREVAQLVAEGLSNKEISDRLVISQRTAEGHVENVLSKLRCKSRSQVAALFAAGERAHT
jgi:predicted ATPase/DNA-binding CsgD family transcriptional regulator